MTQEEIWINHVKNVKVEDIIDQYNRPAIFQSELVALMHNEIPKGSKIIEIGSELGVVSLLLSDQFETTLLDLNPLAIALTQKAHQALNKQADFMVADMFQMPIRDKHFDAVFNAGVIEHFNQEERTRAFIEYKRILKDDGVMIIAFPNHYSLPYRLAYQIRTFLKKWPYPNEFKLYDLRQEIEASGLILERRTTLSKKSLMNWLSFVPPLKWIFQGIDKFYDFEGYLTVLMIRKKM